MTFDGPAVIENALQAALTAVAATAFLAALWYQRRASKARAGLRAAFLDDCKTVFEHGTKAVAATGFPRLSGHYCGHDFDLQVVSDTLNLRKLPALWLLVSLPEPLPLAATFDMMLRPRGVETFSRFASLPVQITPHAGFPVDCAIRTDNPHGIPSEDLLRRHLGFLDDPRVKELLISPKGVRVVWLAEEAHRGKYLLFRDAEMGLVPFKADDLRPILDYLIALHRDIATHASKAPT